MIHEDDRLARRDGLPVGIAARGIGARVVREPAGPGAIEIAEGTTGVDLGAGRGGEGGEQQQQAGGSHAANFPTAVESHRRQSTTERKK